MKKATKYNEQIKLLKKRGLKSINNEVLEHFLMEVNYYRLTGYCKLFVVSNGKDKFVDNFTMDELIKIYKFDCCLRNSLNKIIDPIEISVKTQIAYHLSNQLSPLFYTDKDNFCKQEFFESMSKVINECINDNINEQAISHYYKEGIPIWVLIEYLPIGAVSRMYSNLKGEYKKIISLGSLYQINYSYFVNYLSVLSYLRNICAHRGRLYGRYFSCNPKFTSNEIIKLQINYDKYKCTLFMCLFVIIKLIPNDNLKSEFITDLEKLFHKYKNYIELNKIGFPSNWKVLLKQSD